MLDCLILGDSIAKGIAAERPECVQVTQVGATSEQFKYEVINQPDVFKPGYKHVVISLGTNDGKLIHSFTHLLLLRQNITASRVTWILPATKYADARDGVREVADVFGDSILEIPDKVLEKDRTHPTTTGYHQLAEQTKR
jgi:hypothetical protein